MKTVTTISELRAHIAAARVQGQAVGFVPTMGALHAGHLALIDAVRQRTDCVVASVFVNPLQFGPRDDFHAYPRDVPADTTLARARGVDLLFTPSVSAMYPVQPMIVVAPAPASPDVPALDARWEGATRPGHFGGVLTVVAKLFNIVTPDVVAFGRKDLQQATLVRALVRDLDWPIELVIVPTVRDADGLALSSRNAYLSAAERTAALALPRALGAMQRAWMDDGITDADTLIAAGRQVLDGATSVVVDYLAVADPADLTPLARVTPGAVALIAARVGRTRLIDNVEFSPGERLR